MTAESPTRALGNNYGAVTDGRGATVALFHPSAAAHAASSTRGSRMKRCALAPSLLLSLSAQDAWEAEKAGETKAKWPDEPKQSPHSLFLSIKTGGFAATARIHRIECGRFCCC